MGRVCSWKKSKPVILLLVPYAFLVFCAPFLHTCKPAGHCLADPYLPHNSLRVRVPFLIEDGNSLHSAETCQACAWAGANITTFEAVVEVQLAGGLTAVPVSLLPTYHSAARSVQSTRAPPS